jgi:ubiquitin-like modifier-activating enzyme ATG7
MMNSNTPSFSCCTACSPAAVEAWREEGFGFVRKVAADDGSWLEKLCGLQKLKESAMDVDWDEDGDSDEDF